MQDRILNPQYKTIHSVKDNNGVNIVATCGLQYPLNWSGYSIIGDTYMNALLATNRYRVCSTCLQHSEFPFEYKSDLALAKEFE